MVWLVQRYHNITLIVLYKMLQIYIDKSKQILADQNIDISMVIDTEL